MPLYLTLCRCTLAAAVALVAAVPAPGQDSLRALGPAGFPIAPAAVEGYARSLGLSAEQRDAAMALLTGYRAAVRRAGLDTDTAVAAIDRGASDDTPAAYHKGRLAFAQAAVGLADRVEALESAFFADLGALLDAEQASRFILVERARRREIVDRFQTWPGEGADPGEVLRAAGVDLATQPDAAARLAEWEDALDRPVRDKVESLRRFPRLLAEHDANDGSGIPLLGKMLPDLSACGRRIRDVNRTHVRLMQQALPPDKAAAVGDAFLARAYPRIYGPSPIDAAIAQAESLSGVDGRLREALAGIRDEYRERAVHPNAAWAAAVDQTLNEVAGDYVARTLTATGGPLAGEVFTTARRARLSLDQRFVERIRAELPPDQRARLVIGEPIENLTFPELFPDCSRLEEDPAIDPE